MRWTIPVTAGGCQVSKRGLARGIKQGGMRHVQLCIITRVRVHIGTTELMKDTSCMMTIIIRMNVVDNLNSV